MVKAYLEKVKEGYISRKTELTLLSKQCQTKYKENMEMLKLLEDSLDPNYAAFSPREVSGYNKEKIETLKEDQKVLKEELSSIREEISNVDLEIYEVDSVIRVLKDSGQSMGEEFTNHPELNRYTILQTQEFERQRIARDLHDTTVQSLTSLVHKSELCIKLIDMDPIRCKLELTSISKILRDVIDDTRRMIYDLRPMSFDDIGLDVTVERALDKLKAGTNINYDMHVEGNPYELDQITGITILRIIQEACSNSVKHGKATIVRVTMDYEPDRFILTVSDNGEGFDPKDVPEDVRENHSGFGLSMMRDRIFLLSGKIQVESAVGKGCTIKVEIPVSKEEK